MNITFPQCMMSPNGTIVRFHDGTNGEPYNHITNSFRPIEGGWINALSGHWTPCADPTKLSKTKVLLDHVRGL